MQPTLPTNRPPAGSLVSCFAPPPGRVLWVLLLGLFLSSPLHLWAQTTRYVSTTGTAAASGATSWASSTTNLQGAIDYVANTAPNSGTVYVASGVYRPGGNANTNRAVSFSMANGVTIEGGYAGSGTPGTRTPLSSTLSGNIGSPGSTTDNSYHVIFNNANGLTATAVLDGFVVTGGQATASSSGDDGNGGGIFNRTVSPTLRNLRIEGNTAFNYGGGLYADRGSSNLNSLTIASNYSADHGAGIYATSHTLVATNTLIQSNTASVFPGEGSGGGLYASGGSSNLTSLTVTGNSAFSGGGIYTTSNHSLTAINSRLQSNSALSVGFQGGGGLYASGGSSNLNSLTLVSNHSYGHGGGIYTASSHTLTATNSLIQSNTSLANSGGGLFVSGGSINLTSLTIANNRANTNGGGIFAASSLTAINSIIQSNTATGSSGNGGGLYAQGGRSLLVNTLWQANNAVNLGGAAYLTSNNALTLTNNTLLGNTAPRGSVMALGVSGVNSPTATLLNTLAFGNGSAPNSVTLVATGPTVSASNCLFETGTPGFTNGTNNNIVTPTSPFVTGSYQLSANSQAIDAGNNAATGLSLVSTDLDGGPRIVNSTVDIGADEWSSTSTSLTLTTAVLPNPVCGGSVAALSVTATNGTPAYSYTWVAPAGVVITAGGSTSSASVSANAGVTGVQTLTVNVSDAASQTATAQVSLTFGAPPANPSLVAGGTLSCGQTVSLTATTSSAGSFSYAFAGPGLSSPNATAGTATASAGGLYSMTVTNLTTGCTASTTATVQTSTAVVSVTLVSSHTLTCAQTSATLTAQATGIGSLTYAFTGGVLAGTPGSASTIAVSQGGTYTVLVTAANGCTASTTATVVSNTATPASFAVAGSGTATCASSPTVSLAGSEVGVNYQLRRDGVNTGGAVPGTGSALSFGPQSTSGVYTVLATNPTTSCTLAMAQSATVESNATPVSVSLGVSGTLTCAQTSVTLTADATGSGSLTYTFTGGALAGTPGSASTVAVSQGGTYTVRVTAANGCTNTATATVQSNTTAPAVSIGASAPGFGCGVTSITLTANVPTGATYAWEDASSTPTRVVSASGTYGLSATATNGCSATATSVTLGTGGGILPTVTLVFNNGTVVAGAGTATITLPATPGQQFQVFGGSSYEFLMVIDRINGYEIRQVDSTTTGIFTIKRGGPFTVTVREATGCSRTVQGVIVVR